MMRKKREIVPLLVAYTKPKMWESIKKRRIATQAANAPDAENIAFILTGTKDENGKNLSGILAYIAEVENTKDMSVDGFLETAPELKNLYKEKNWKGSTKCYFLKEIKKLPKSIPHKKGDKSRGQVRFYTTLEELNEATVLSDIKTLDQIEKTKKKKQIY